MRIFYFPAEFRIFFGLFQKFFYFFRKNSNFFDYFSFFN